MDKPKLFITGGHGMVGSRFRALYGNDFEVLVPSIEEMSLLNPEQVKATIEPFQPDIVLHFAAFTDVGKAEAERDNEQGMCWQVNVEGTKNLINASKSTSATLIYISTDYVFDGSSGPYTETDTPMTAVDQGTWYGWTKLLGEKVVAEDYPKSVIARFSLPFVSHYAEKLDFVRSMYQKMQSGTLHPLFTDQIISPTFVDDIADALTILIKTNAEGIYHVAGSTRLSPYEVGVELAKTFDFDQNAIKQTTIAEFLETKKDDPYAAVRYPKNSALDNTKIQALVHQHGKTMHTLAESFASMKAQGIRVQ